MKIRVDPLTGLPIIQQDSVVHVGGGGGGSGDVVGPASATDNAIVRFDSTTGKLIQTSLASVSDSAVLTVGNGSPYSAQIVLNGSGGGVATFSVGSTSGNVSVDKSFTATNISGTNTGDQDLSSYVTLTGAQTLTNKTINAGQFTGVNEFQNGSTIALYNTADQTTNYEKVTQRWSGNIYAISTLVGGTGTARYLRLGTSATAGSASPTRFLDLVPSGSNTFSFTSPSSLAGNIMTMTGIDLQGASVSQTAVAINPQIHQSGTANYTALLVNPSETATGSGAKLLADFQVGGTSKTRIDNTGSHYLSSGATMTSFNTTDETTNYERVSTYWAGNQYVISNAFGGTASQRAIKLQSHGSITLNANATGGGIQLADSTSGVGSTVAITRISGTLTGASSFQGGLIISPTLNQSSTASYTALLINPTETATGSGAKRLLDLQVGGTTKFNVDNTGIATVAAVGTTAGSLVSVDGAQTLTNKTLTNPLVNKILDINGNSAMLFNATANAVNYAWFVNGATGNSVSMRANGSDTNIPFALFSKGSGQVQLRSDTNGFIFTGDSVASGVNYVGITNAATGSGPIIVSTGSDTNIDLTLKAKGTGNLLIPSGTGSLQYNTTDQTTNYERARMYWSGNIYNIMSEAGGTGTRRVMYMSALSSSTAGLKLNTSTVNGVLEAVTTSSTAGAINLKVSGTWTASSGVQYGTTIVPTVNQTSTAGYTALLVNPTETGVGSGSNLLADFQVGGTSKVSIKNDGVIFPVQAATASAPTYVKGGVYFDTTLNKLRVGGASGWETITSI